MTLKWIVKHEPVILGGFLIGVAVFFAVRYGTHAGGALQGTTGGLTASFVAFLSRWVGPSAMQDVTGIANDLAALKDQIGPLPKKGGIVSVTEALGKTVVEKRQEIAAIGEAIKADIEDLWNHKAQASFDPPKLTTGPTAGTAPTGGQVTIHEPETVPTVAEPVSEAPTPAADAVAELAALVP